MLSRPHSIFPSPAARPSPLTCAVPPELNRPHLPGVADRVWMLMRKAWVGKWSKVGVPIMNVLPAATSRLHSARVPLFDLLCLPLWGWGWQALFD